LVKEDRGEVRGAKGNHLEAKTKNRVKEEVSLMTRGAMSRTRRFYLL
jgi:hypothetical protein